MVDGIEISNDGARVQVTEADPADLDALRGMPDLRHVWLDGISLTKETLRLVAGLPQIAALTISGCHLTADQFSLLDALPPGTAVKVEDLKHDSPEWNAFRHRRANRAARLSSARRQEAADRYALGIASISWKDYDGGHTVEIQHGDAVDDDIRLLRWLPQMETLHFHRCWGVTSGALRHLAGHPRLKTINFNGPTFTGPLRPLSRCPSLESFDFFPEDGSDPGDAHTLGLDQIAGLRRLKGWAGCFTEPTLARIGRLAELRYLSLPLGMLEGDDSLRHLAGLRNLEYLSLATATPFSDACLRHLSGLTRLRALELSIEAGNGEGFRHLAELERLQFLTLNGDGVTDAGIKHLHGLTCLKIFQSPWGKVTPKAAAELAEALPDVAVHLEGKVFKTPQKIVRFRRQAVGGFASALIPVRWSGQQDPDLPHIDWTEDGFMGFEDAGPMYSACVSQAEIRLWVEDEPSEPNAATYLKECARNSNNRLPKRFETGVVKMQAGGDTASGMFPRDEASCLAGVALLGGKSGAVQGEAPPKRFEQFRGLFAYVAASLRVGPDALSDEEVDVPATDLA